MASRIPWVLALLGGLAGCEHEVGTGLIDLNALCLEEHPGDVRCCTPDGHIDHGTCCATGTHLVSDVEHADWTLCLPDKNPADAGAELDAGVDGQ